MVKSSTIVFALASAVLSTTSEEPSYEMVFEQRARFGIDVFNIAGLYRMASAADGSWEVQIFNCGVYACAMAARLGKDLIEVIVNRGGSLEYFVNGQRTQTGDEVGKISLDSTHRQLWPITLIRTGARLMNLEVALTTQIARSCLTLSRAGPLAVERDSDYLQ